MTSRLQALARSFPVVVVSGARQVGKSTLLERDGRFFPVEAKGKTRIGRIDARGIRAFRDAYPSLDVAPGLVIALRDRVEKISDDDFALPWDLGGLK